MKKLPFIAAAAALAVVGLSTPAQARVFVGLDIPLVAAAPPAYAGPPVYEAVPPPRPGWYWVPGYRSWNGYNYVWVRGRWAHPPRAGAVWIGPAWANEGGGWRWHRGHWR